VVRIVSVVKMPGGQGETLRAPHRMGCEKMRLSEKGLGSATDGTALQDSRHRDNIDLPAVLRMGRD
jgi:hypothetical protein